MSKYIRGVKRNQIIQRWLQGIEDPEWEVFPTKKEGKYIVKMRESKLPAEETVPTSEEPVPASEETVPTTEESVPEPEPIRRPRKQPATQPLGFAHQQGINLEILEQLRSLGEELRNDRFKREQKQYIKQVVNKELSKSRIRSRYVPDTLVPEEPEPVVRKQDPEPEPVCRADLEPVEPEPVELPPTFRSRIRR